MSLMTMLESLGTLKRPTIGRDAREGTTQDPFRLIVADVPCSVQQSSVGVQELYFQRQGVTPTTIYMMDKIAAEPNDIFIVTDNNGNVFNFQVVGPCRPVVNRTITGTELWQMECSVQLESETET